MIKKLDYGNLELEPTEDCIPFGCVFKATLTDDEVLSIPMVWTARDVNMQQNPTQISNLFKSLFENTILSMNDFMEISIDKSGHPEWCGSPGCRNNKTNEPADILGGKFCAQCVQDEQKARDEWDGEVING